MKPARCPWLAAVALLGTSQTAEAQVAPRPESKAQPLGSTGDVADTRATLEARVAERPEDADALRRLAAADAAAGDLKAARRHIDRALLLAPQDLDIQLARANILLWSGQLEAASRQGDAIAAVAPDYPELAAFQSTLAKRRAESLLRISSLSFSQQVSRATYTDGSWQTWSAQDAAVAIRFGRRTAGSMQFEHEDRGVSDTRISGRFDRYLEKGQIYLAGSVTPDPDFRESWSVAGGAEVRLGKSASALLDVRYAAYRSADVLLIQAGLRRSLSQDVRLTGRMINLFGGGSDYRIGGSIRLDYSAAEKTEYFLTASSYPDTEADGTRQTTGFAVGAAIALDDRLTLRTGGEFEQRQDSYHRLTATVGLAWRFDGR